MTFRLLDPYVGWDETGDCTLVGLDDPAGLRLPRLGPAPDGPDRDSLLPWFPDPRLAPAWYLLTGDQVLRRDGCGGFAPVAGAPEPVAVAAAGHWLAVAAADGVHVWWREGEQLTGIAEAGGPAARLALTASGTVLVAAPAGTDLRVFGPDGLPRRTWRTGLPGRVDGLRVGPDHRVWLLIEDAGAWRLFVAERIGAAPATASVVDLRPSTLVAATADGFCLSRPETVDADAGVDCYDWRGRPRDATPETPAPTLAAEGELTTTAIDSGLSRCRWHRIRVDADVPAAATLRVSVAVTEDAEPAESDWQHAATGATDVLVDQPPGRYLYLRLRLESDGVVTPVVRRIRLDFPRSTSADLLPAAFREDPAADDFTERFLSLFDATIEDIDRVIDRYPGLLDDRTLDAEALPWLGGLLGLAFESGWDTGVRRALIAAAPRLFRGRGTAAAVREAVSIVFGVEPVIDELWAERAWLRVGTDGRLGSARLSGRARGRMRVGAALAGAPLNSAGDPYADPLREHAYRLRVSLPARAARPPDPDALARLLRSQTPAHTVAEVHRGGLGWVLGVRSVLGVDTALEPLPPTVLGPVAGGNPVRLNRQSVLAARRRGPDLGMTVGERAVVGVTSVAW